jgi:hypothetical protein
MNPHRRKEEWDCGQCFDIEEKFFDGTFNPISLSGSNR